MEWRGPVKPTYIDLPTDLRQQLKTEAARRGKTIRAAVQEALELWLGPDSGSRDPDPDAAMLLECKQIASPDDYAALRQNVLVFLRDARRALASRQRKGA